MSRTRIHNLAISLDGFATREPQSTEAPFGHAGQRLHDWMFGTRFWRGRAPPVAQRTRADPSGVDHAFAERHGIGFGAEIMGANKFGPRAGRTTGLEGLVGAEPALPHAGLRPHPPPAHLGGDGRRHHVPLPGCFSPAEALEKAREAAGGQDVRLGGGPSVARDYLAEGLVDHMHLVQVPIVLGRGVRLWDGLESLDEAYSIEAVSTPSGVTHLTFTRRVP